MLDRLDELQRVGQGASLEVFAVFAVAPGVGQLLAHTPVFVEPVGNHPRAPLRAAQFALEVVEVAIADAAQETPH